MIYAITFLYFIIILIGIAFLIVASPFITLLIVALKITLSKRQLG